MPKQKKPDEFLICTTVYLKGQPQQLLVNGYVMAEADTEVDLFFKARKLGIDLATLKPQKAVGDNDHFFVNWMGAASVAQYLGWKGIIGPGAALKRAAKLIAEGE